MDVGTSTTFSIGLLDSHTHVYALQSKMPFRYIAKKLESVKSAALLKKVTITYSNLNLPLASTGHCLVYSILPSGAKVVQCYSAPALCSGKGYISMTCGSLHHLETAIGPSRW